MATEILIINYFRAGRFYLKRNSRQTSRHGTNTNVPAVSTHKVILLIFRKYRPPPPSTPVSALTILAYTPPPSISVQIKGYMKEIYFVNHIKGPQTTLKVTSAIKLFFAYNSASCVTNEFFYLKKNCFVLEISRFFVFVKLPDFKICDVVIRVAA